MSISSPITVRRALGMMANDRLILPGIQRSFVWRPKQIEALFDSLMRGYPIGSLLLWGTRPADHPHLRFLRIVTNYQGKLVDPDKAHPKRTAPVYAVLDGQQRLTALNIGLRGSYAGSATAPGRRLFLDLDTDQPDAGSESNRFRFEFRASGSTSDGTWFPVSEAIGLGAGRDQLTKAMRALDLPTNDDRRKVLRRLANVVNREPIVRLDTQAGDLDRVLNVFARINKGGTTLSYVDLLVGTATARWTRLVARDEITALRREMNQASREDFDFSEDRIVKAGLVLVDASTKFHVESFLSGNRAQELERVWPKFRRSMLVAAQLLDSFGLSARTLPAENVLIPIAYYAHHRGLGPAYVVAHSHESDRRRVRAFVARTMLQRAYWTGAVDAVLVACRSAIRAHGDQSFPLHHLERALGSVKSIGVTDDFVDELATLRFGDRRTAVLLRLLFPHMVHEGPSIRGLDKDHVFPTSRLPSAPPTGLSMAAWNDALWVADRLPNLQLLRAEDNQGGGKVAQMPKQWLAGLSPSARRRYSRQYVKHLPDTVTGAPSFWDRREQSLRVAIRRLLMP